MSDTGKGTVPSPELVGPYLDEIAARIAAKIHELCVAEWRRRGENGAVAITQHGVDAHRVVAEHLAPTVHVLAYRLIRASRESGASS